MSALDVSQIVATQESILALIAYDYVLTLPQEVNLFWRRRVNVSSMLFFAVRYLAIAYYVGLVYYRTIIRPYPPIRCKFGYVFNMVLRYLEYLPWAIFSALRVYALSFKCWPLGAFVFFWSIIPLVLNYYVSTVPSFLSLLIVIQSGLIIADATVIGVTWKTTYRARKGGQASLLTQVIFRDGKQLESSLGDPD
ncbi:hypothetical protein LXA43DRAFT_974446 [Ganoderma leucocontextum]|nr:hypothetical protein LXA43DRAFT_974446 [Ganoderma leucocontextum]